MAYKDAKKANISNLTFRKASYHSTGSFSKQYKEAKKANKSFKKV